VVLILCLRAKKEQTLTLPDLQARVEAFRDEREWAQFHSHSLKDRAAAIAVEAAELQELFLCVPPDDELHAAAARRDAIANELADVLIQSLKFASGRD
jgi:dCTP diphosphatase